MNAGFITTNQDSALGYAGRLIANISNIDEVKIFVTEKTPNAWGQCRRYQIGVEKPAETVQTIVCYRDPEKAKRAFGSVMSVRYE
jgi:hypothetical protein